MFGGRILVPHLLLLMACANEVSAFADSPTAPAAVWAGFDPRDEPLEIEILKHWSERGAASLSSRLPV